MSEKKYCEECQNLSDLCYYYEDEIGDLRAKVSRRTRELVLGGTVLLGLAVALIVQVNVACGATWPLLAPDGSRRGEVRERFWGRRNRDGSVELFGTDGRRTGTVDRNGALRVYPL